MDSRTVALVLLLISYICATPVPGKKVTLVKDSSLGLSGAAAGSKTAGVVEDNNSGDAPSMPKNVDGGEDTEVVGLDKVNAGGTYAVGDSIGTGLVKNNKFDGPNPFLTKE